MHIRRDEQVLVISGEYRGKKGRVLKVFPEKKRIIVEGVNFISRHMRPSQSLPQGGIIKKEASIDISNVMVICPKCDTPTRTGVKILTDETKGIRSRAKVCRQCGEMIDAGA